MIHLGLAVPEKLEVIRRYLSEHQIRNTFIISPERFRFECALTDAEHILYPDVIMYVTFYRLLQQIGPDTLVVLNECLRDQNRHNLTYNCIRHFLNQTTHQIVFQYLPLIAEREDFMTLVDWDTRSRWKRERFSPGLLRELDLHVQRRVPMFDLDQRAASAALHEKYVVQREGLFAALGSKDPHTVPRHLYQLGGRERLARVRPGRCYAARNNRFKLSNFRTYREISGPGVNGPYHVFELPHNFIDFSDFLTVTGQPDFTVLGTDLPVDVWYAARYQEWAGLLGETYAALHR